LDQGRTGLREVQFIHLGAPPLNSLNTTSNIQNIGFLAWTACWKQLKKAHAMDMIDTHAVGSRLNS
jgi:hypothetical protein